MTNKFKLSVCLLTAACFINVLSLYAENSGKDDNGEDVPRIICKCQTGFLTNNKCLASNSGNPCAQSEAGGNISCQDYNTNCK